MPICVLNVGGTTSKIDMGHILRERWDGKVAATPVSQMKPMCLHKKFK
jgi:hypothetical protein